MDGTCNHDKQSGSSMMAFRRVLPPDYADGISEPRKGKMGNDLPSARQVSLQVHPPAPSYNPQFTVMLAVFGQFLDHDITATAISQGANGSSLLCCPPTHPECFPVQVGPGDPYYDLTKKTCMDFVRSAPAPQCKIGPRQQLNQVYKLQNQENNFKTIIIIMIVTQIHNENPFSRCKSSLHSLLFCL